MTRIRHRCAGGREGLRAAAWLGICLALGSASLAAEPAPATVASLDAERLIVVTLRQDATDFPPPAGSSRRLYGAPRDYQATPQARRQARKLARAYGLRRVDEWPIELLGVHCVVYEVGDERPRKDVVALLARDRRVHSVQPMNVFETRARTYDDPYLHLQHGLRALQATEAHRWATGKGVRVAMVDTGVDSSHPELSVSVTMEQDFVGDTGGTHADPHGTAVAGVIASASGNGVGIVGVAPGAEILALRACWPATPGATEALCNTFTLAKALHAAILKRAAVLNLSLTGPADPLLASLVSEALDRGLVVVGALDPGGEDGPGFPSSLEGVIAVRAVEGAPATGIGLEHLARRLVAAPGVDVLTTEPGGSFRFLSGSSVAAAHVSGVAALLLEVRPDLTSDGILALLRETSRQGIRPATGSGRGSGINACAAVARLVGGPPCPGLVVAAR